jgi:anti-anti-sigma regulatory factor
MLARDFALTVERLGTGTTALVLAGELDLYRAPEIEHALAEAIEPQRDHDQRRGSCGALSADGGEVQRPRRVVVDLRSVTFLDSTLLALLLDASRRQHRRGGELLVLVGPQTPMTAFEATGFDRLLAMKRVGVGPKASAA